MKKKNLEAAKEQGGVERAGEVRKDGPRLAIRDALLRLVDAVDKEVGDRMSKRLAEAMDNADEALGSGPPF